MKLHYQPEIQGEQLSLSLSIIVTAVFSGEWTGESYVFYLAGQAIYNVGLNSLFLLGDVSVSNVFPLFLKKEK